MPQYDALWSADLIQNQIHTFKDIRREATSLHTHDFMEILYIPYGNGWHTIGETTYPLAPGDIAFIPVGTPHAVAPIDHQTMIVYNCIYCPEFLPNSMMHSSILQHLADPLFSNAKSYQENIKQILEQMMTEEQTIHTAHLDMLRGYLLVLLAYFSRALEENALNNTNRKKQHPGVQTAVSYIKNHYMEHITIEQLALLCFLSQSHLSRLFKEDTGLSITEFIQTVRITKACQLLKSTSLSVSAIAAQVGYQDMHYFNHIFRKIAGCTPGKYRSGTLL